MKRIILSLMALLLTLGISAQTNDSILIEKMDNLKKEIVLLKKKQKSLQSQVYQLQKAHKTDLQQAEEKFASTDEALEACNARITELEDALKTSKENTLESITVLGSWTKKVIMILGIILLALFIVLLILVITNRTRIEKDYMKLEAKVDNTKEAVELEVKEMTKRYEEDITALKALVEKGKK